MPHGLACQYFPLILDVLDQGVFTIDREGRVTSFNRAAEAITGYPAAEALGQPCSAVFRSDLCGKACPLQGTIRSGQQQRDRHVSIRTRDGASLPIAVTTSPLVGEDGVVVGGVEVFRDLSPVLQLKRRLDGRYRLEDIIGKSPGMKRVFDLLPLVADSHATVLVTGPSGTGKELVARTIHGLSPRRKGPFVAVNCAALPDTLLESELFGYVRGAFTDARHDKPGRIAAAEGGTLFLDEIGDLPTAMQPKVLRFLEDKTYEPLGSNRSHKASVRVLSATNRDLLGLVATGRFREDLYFRLNVIQVDIPPLSQRPEDIPLLVDHYVKLFRASTGKAITGLTDEAMAALLTHPFRGNVRELENLVERAFVLCLEDRIGLAHLPEGVARPGALPPSVATPHGTVAQAEAAAIEAALQKHGGNRTHAARELGMHRSTLIRKLKQGTAPLSGA
jgi:PAS domain S-box-containing protein